MKTISRRKFVKQAAVITAGMTLSPLSSLAAEAKKEKRPNLLFVFPDEFRQQAMGFMKADPVITPNLDRLAAGGMVLTNAVSNYPVCSPYRAMLMTGKYPFSNGVIGNCTSKNAKYGVELRAWETCFSDVLHDADYHLGYIGKWHLDAAKEPFVEKPREDGVVWDAFVPPERRHSFDFWHSFNAHGNHMKPHYWVGDKLKDKKSFKKWAVEHEADVAIEYIKNKQGNLRDADKPFALFWAPNPPHMPFDQVPDKYKKMYQDKSVDELLNRPNVNAKGRKLAGKHVKNYFAAITGIDEQFGRILQTLKEQGLEQDTIVVFTADHGEMMGSHGRMYKNLWYDESMLIPFIVRWPGKIKPGRDGLHLSVPDVMPSLLGLMGLQQSIPESVEGSDHSAIMLGNECQRPDSALYMNVNVENPDRSRFGVRTDRYTFVAYRGSDIDQVEQLASTDQSLRKPDGKGALKNFEAPTNWADRYGTRVRGFLHPPETGDYTFWIASDDDGKLYLSTNEMKFNMRDIAAVKGWTGPKEWEKYKDQKSQPIHLEAGQRYYIEALHLEGGGEDNLAVAWQGPGMERQVIEGKYLSMPDKHDKQGKILREYWQDLGLRVRYRLYDNQKDPYQLEDIAEKKPKIVKKMKQELNKWLKKVKNPWGKV